MRKIVLEMCVVSSIGKQRTDDLHCLEQIFAIGELFRTFLEFCLLLVSWKSILFIFLRKHTLHTVKIKLVTI